MDLRNPLAYKRSKSESPLYQEETERPERRKLVVVGDGAAGKTSILWQISKGNIPTEHIPTVVENSVIHLRIKKPPSFIASRNNRPNSLDESKKSNVMIDLELTLWDTAGQEELDRIRPITYPNTDILLLVCSVDNPDSLFNIKAKWNTEVSHYCRGVPKILVANKLDLADDPRVRAKLKDQGLEIITAEQLEKVRKEIKADSAFIVSALSGINIKNLFEAAGALALSKPKARVRKCQIF
ncbi:ras-like GTP-binding protein rhoA isoform X2 [Eurytemora carolleeae]|uniref:ras-like GTP-binding protein rhoA isoform X2 n=1 Tax=Eurytemora carolleeae TaxID=1294199 RepID=UPI000C77FD1E|nr:ras-like GTP-binding protein rhoA isoform X2 [Eurytemora carolleeae]XP_023344425.1 ras-like GTP-binding protein rhoA isoform X2 [Eurytemora carolleeae]|eukprot:XP_023344424.1 ras-like GTP-binding protein rhoA isoform X2 [Eurytemora affinis]